MSKVICEVCGTAYADSAEQCPICGTAKTLESAPAPGDGTAGREYAYVKGGRFSQSNVRKKTVSRQDLPREKEEPRPRRNQEQPARPRRQAEEKKQPSRRQRPEETENEQPSNIGLIIVVVVLLLAIISLCAYVAIRFINMNNARKASENANASSSSQLQNIACEGLSIPGPTEYTMTDLSDEVIIEVVCQPSNTTDLLNWNFDASVVDVSKSGNNWVITPVGSGETRVEVTCGAFSASLTIICDIQNIPCTGVTIQGGEDHLFTSAGEQLILNVVTEPASTTEAVEWTYDESVISISPSGAQWIMVPIASGETDVTVTCGTCSATIHVTCNLEANFVLELTKEDISMSYYGETARIYNGSVDASLITWVSSDETIATIVNGVVTAVGPGTCTVSGVYGNQYVECIVRCKSSVVPNQGTDTPDFFIYTQYGKPSGPDVTISVGEVLNISLRDSDGLKITEGLTFRVSSEEHLSINENGRLTGLAPTGSSLVYVYVDYQGVTYELRIIVRNS